MTFINTILHWVIQTQDIWDQHKKYGYGNEKGGEVFKGVFSIVVNTPAAPLLMTPRSVSHLPSCCSGSKAISP